MAGGLPELCMPLLPGDELLQDAARSIVTACRTAVVAYDPATQTGVIYSAETAQWIITTPIDFGTFALTVASSGYALTDCSATRAWYCANRDAGDVGTGQPLAH